MEREGIAFSVQMTAKEIYKFTVYHVYHGFSGLFGLFLSLLALFNLILNFGDMTDQTRVIMCIVALWFTVLEPLMMIGRSKSQLKRTKSYQKPLHYLVDENGVTVTQDEESQTLPWERLTKIVETNSQFLVYSSRIHAFIFPKNMMEGQSETVKQMMLRYTEGAGIQLKGKMKRAGKTHNDRV